MNNENSDDKILFNTVEEAIEDLRSGRPIIVADDENRENEGDLVIPAEMADAKVVNFMLNEARGIVCLAITEERAKELQLEEMVRHNTDLKQTAFTVSVDADVKFGVTTGVSAYDRAKTIEVAIAKTSKPEDLRRPGHIFPLVSKKGGVLERVGHTEASIDLAKLAGMYPSAVICEILNPDGTMARRDNLVAFAKKHGLKFITVAQIIAHRLKTERFVKCMATAKLPTKFGDFEIRGYVNSLTGQEHVAIVKESNCDKVPLVRVHSECLTGDIFCSLRCDCNSQLQRSLELIEEHGRGALVYLKGHEGRGIGIVNKIKAYNLQDQGQDTVQANISLGFASDLRDYGVGAQILTDLGYRKFNLLTNNPKKIIGLEGYGLEVLDRIPLQPSLNEYNKRYIMTKKEKMEHLIT